MTNKITGAELKSAFYMEPERVVEFFESKGLKTTYDWREMLGEAHAKAFTVAKMTDLDLLKDTKKLLEENIKNGGTYEEFKKEAMNLFAKKGWTGFKEVTNPKTGEKETVELGTPRRLKIIYTNNIISAYAAGKYKELLEEADVAPYWMYNCMMDGRERPEHRALHGKVYRCDDPFWDSFYPPNGWGCRCWVTNLTKRQLDKKGLTVEPPIKQTEPELPNAAAESAAHDDMPPDNIPSSANPQTPLPEQPESADTPAETHPQMPLPEQTVPADIPAEPNPQTPVYKFENAGKFYTLKPDTGWGTNPAKYAWGIDVAAWNKVSGLPDDIKFKFISEMAENPYKKEVLNRLIDKTIKNGMNSFGIEMAISWFTPEILTELKNLDIPLNSPVVVFQDRQVKHSLGSRKYPEQKLTEKQFRQIYDYIHNPDEIFIDTQEHAIVYVKFLDPTEIVDNRDCIKIPVIINSNRPKRPVNYIGTTGRINYAHTFKGGENEKRFKKIR